MSHRRTPARGHRRPARSVAFGSGLAAVLHLLLAGTARAGSADPYALTEATADGGAPPAPTVMPSTIDGGAAPAASEALIAGLEEQKQELREQKEALKEAQQAVGDLQQKVDVAAAANEDRDWTNRFKIYGFTDVGLNRAWVDEKSQAGAFLSSANATSFVVGNLNVYFDAQPVKGWRSLVEIRFTNAPHGEVASLGGLAGQFRRTSTMQNDPHAGSAVATMWGGYTVIERAHIDWTDLRYLKVRVGNFFTPFGIWNVDHGTPTLIAVQLPGVIQLRQMPLRQTGVQIYGNTFAGEWEVGYTATVSNGRQELSNFAFDDNRGFGGRVYANNEKGSTAVKLGASFYTGRVRDQQIHVTGVAPLTFDHKSTFDYREIVGGVDASVDVGRTRIRAEAAMNSIQHEEGQHQTQAGVTPTFKPNLIHSTAYMLVAHTLPFAPIEVYGTADVGYGPMLGIGNVTVAPGVGVNIRFTKATMLKTQFTQALLFDTEDRLPASEISKNNASFLFSRLVLVF